MTKKNFIILGCFLLLGYIFYVGKYSNEGILKNVIERDGYDLHQMANKETIKLFIKPEWIPFTNEKEQNFELKLTEKHNTNILLVQVWNRGEDIYFSFDTSYNLNYSKGTFLYNGIFNEDGTFSTSGSFNDYNVYNQKGEKCVVGQNSQGPNSAFGFAIEPENYDVIKDGFFVEYSGFYLYEYSKK
ncbi:hypothetical protein SAMN05880501_12312 [Ureibacillus xyleni]|uniref:Uncharacterized protein n=1 Tax=Ureibacillus xyleni TaxID=614648 RepID=A0A285TTV2_9BACL|nr:hypothetical protein [Ureibacillus xyleni]SOC27543.1 hypothetical protein SAMN05880501_12312 [Ureibacillus xyleni]